MLLELESATVVCEALILPRLILLAGFAPGRATPFTVTLFATNVVPAGYTINKNNIVCSNVSIIRHINRVR